MNKMKRHEQEVLDKLNTALSKDDCAFKKLNNNVTIEIASMLGLGVVRINNILVYIDNMIFFNELKKSSIESVKHLVVELILVCLTDNYELDNFIDEHYKTISNMNIEILN